MAGAARHALSTGGHERDDAGVHPPDHVLDLFAVPGDVRPLPGGSGRSVVAGDLVLSPGRDVLIANALNPRLARLAGELDTRRGRRRRDLRIAMPVPARDGSWVVDGWGATRFEPGTRTCEDLAVTRAAGALLHAEFAQAFTTWEPASTRAEARPPWHRPPWNRPPRHRWDRAYREAFDHQWAGVSDTSEELQSLTESLAQQRDSTPMGPPQMVHGDLLGNVLLDEAGAPVVIDVSPYWAPALWADAVCVLDAVLWCGADPAVLEQWWVGAHRQAMLRAALFRLAADRPDDVSAYRRALRGLVP